ncbi:MAG: glutathione synthase [Pseudomonadales bacterium]|nr:glutathione synthase [Pseudomonadales bacterium]
MGLKFGVLMDPLPTINPKKDSTLAMMVAAQNKGWDIFVIEQNGLFILDAEVQARQLRITIDESKADWYQIEEEIITPASELDVILMRKDPPFDMEYIYTTYMLEQVDRAGTPVLNNPASIRDCNEKLFALLFPECCPPHLVSRNQDMLKAFHGKHQDVIFKPLDGMGGASIFRAQKHDPNLSVILETLTAHGTRQIMAQRFIPEIKQGDTRILLINGEPVPYGLARIPADGETRGNLAAGGEGVARPLNKRDLWIAEQIGPVLREKGLYFVGIDVIGDFLTEINVTCPTCIREIDKGFQLDIAGDYINFIETHLAQ